MCNEFENQNSGGKMKENIIRPIKKIEKAKEYDEIIDFESIFIKK